MRRRKRLFKPFSTLFLGFGACAALACSFFDWNATTTGTDSDSASSGPATDSDNTDNTDNTALCGEPLADPPCVPPTTAPLTALCRARPTQAQCLADADGSSANRCAWALIDTYGAADQSCSPTEQHGECIGLQANDQSCNNSACDGALPATAYYRFNDQCQVETFTASLCGWQVLDWSECNWDGQSPEPCTMPWPSEGPPACRCHC